MIEALKIRLTEIEAEIARAAASADETVHKELLAELERHIEELEARGGTVPVSALRHVRPECDSEIEDQFDNMPI